MHESTGLLTTSGIGVQALVGCVLLALVTVALAVTLFRGRAHGDVDTASTGALSAYARDEAQREARYQALVSRLRADQSRDLTRPTSAARDLRLVREAREWKPRRDVPNGAA